ncbi:hypothetical protein ACP3WE_18210 [Salmonella enterica]|uniref:hypothetical protein n=1 Tax=Salmonella enterica TaxID=28901 RepID=UPI003CF778C7
MRQQLPGGVGLDDRMPSGSREPKVSMRSWPTEQQTPHSKKQFSYHEWQEGLRRRRGLPAFQAGVSLPGVFCCLTGHSPAGTGVDITDGTHGHR